MRFKAYLATPNKFTNPAEEEFGVMLGNLKPILTSLLHDDASMQVNKIAKIMQVLARYGEWHTSLLSFTDTAPRGISAGLMGWGL